MVVLKRDSLKSIKVKQRERCEANNNEGNSAYNEDFQISELKDHKK